MIRWFHYKANGESVDAIKTDDITISLVRERKPRELMRYLEENEYKISHLYPGVYYVEKNGFPQTQIIVSRELDRESHRWLTALTSNMNQAEAQKLVFDIRDLTEKDDKECADSVFDVSLKENRHLFETLRKEGTTSMCEALVELMRPELEAAVKKAREETREEVRAEERANTEREHQRAVAAEEEVQRLREELRRMQNEIQ